MLTFAAKVFAALVLALSLVLPAAAQEPLKVVVTEGQMEPLPIAILDFVPANGASAQVGADISGVVRANLERSGLFRALPQASFIERQPDFDGTPRFGDWRIINAKALVTGRVSIESDGRLKVEYRLWDVFAEQQMDGVQYFTTPESWRRIAHIVSDAIYERLTGERGYFDTQVVFISESGPRTNRTKRLAIMDQDGANPRFLTDGRFLVLTPRFSPNAQAISFMSYERDEPQVFIFDLQSGREETLGAYNGMTFSPRFSPDGNSVVMSLARGGNTDIYLMDLRTRGMTRLTSDPGIDTAPSFSPDGGQIAFESDRSGTQQIYVMNADGSGAQRISFGEGRYATPVWSPRGDIIAFTKMLRGTFGIGVMRTDGSGERRLTESFLDEGPSWAPNGRVIMFTRQAPGGPSQIWSIDLTGQNLRVVPTPGEASDPAWSPNLD